MLSLKDIALLRLEKMREWYPMIPEYALPRKTYSEKDANRLTEAVIDCIDFHGGWATRISVEGRYIESLGHRIPSSTKKGTADIHAVFNSKHLSIEIKTALTHDRMSDKQREVQKDIIAAGGVYLIVTCWDDFAKFFDELLTKERSVSNAK